jgi:hypothetical protein
MRHSSSLTIITKVTGKIKSPEGCRLILLFIFPDDVKIGGYLSGYFFAYLMQISRVPSVVVDLPPIKFQKGKFVLLH